MDIKEKLERIAPFLESKDYPAIAAILAPSAPVDIGELMSNLDRDSIISILQYLPTNVTGEILSYIDPDLAPDILHALGEDKGSAVLDSMYLDDVADILGELEPSKRNQLLNLMEDEDAEDVRELMVYPEGTAGSIMTTEFVALNQNVTAEEAIHILRNEAPSAETVYYVYVIDDDDVLVGVLSLRDLIVTPPSWTLEHIMHTRVKVVTDYMDQEEVATLVSRYDIMAVPVVDHDHRLVGIITVDDILDVIEEEATEDVLRMAGSHEDELDEDDTFTEKIVKAVKVRLPWLLITLFGGFVSGFIMNNIEADLEAVVALAYFIPLLLGLGGNVGTQSSTVTVRGISTGQVDSSKIFINVLRESFVGIIAGFCCAIILCIVAYIWLGNAALSVLVGVTLLCNMMISAFIGTFVPLVLKKAGVDPAVASAPFISTGIDIIGLLVYAALAAVFMPMLLGVI
jgi:magnesium transporter